jgi:hypothetical protein
MVGYLMDNEVSRAFASVRSEIVAKKATLRVRAHDGIRTPSGVLPNYEWSADTFHDRTEGTFSVHHVLLGVAT